MAKNRSFTHIEFRCKMDKDTNVDNTTMTSLRTKYYTGQRTKARQNKPHSEPEKKTKQNKKTQTRSVTKNVWANLKVRSLSKKSLMTK